MRPIWKGFLQLSIVAIPIKLSPVTAAGSTLTFSHLHAACRSRLQPPHFCPRCNRDVPGEETVKGYRYASQRYLLIAEEEPERIEVPAPTAVIIQRFADRAELAALDFDDCAYGISPDGPSAAEAHGALRDAMRGRGRVAFGALALGGQEQTVVLVPWEQNLLLHLPHPAAETRTRWVQPGEDPAGPCDATPSREGYRQALRGLIEAEVGGQRNVRPQAGVVGGANTPDLLDEFDPSADGMPLPGPGPAGREHARKPRRRTFVGVGCLLLAAMGGAGIWHRPVIEEWLRSRSPLPALGRPGGARSPEAPGDVGATDAGPPREAGPLAPGERPAPEVAGPLPSGPVAAPPAETPISGASNIRSPAPEAVVPPAGKDLGSTGETTQSAQEATPATPGARGATGGARRPGRSATTLTVAPSPWILWTRRDRRADAPSGGQLLAGAWRPTENFEKESECRLRLLQSFKPTQEGGWFREAGQEQIRAGCRPAAAGRPGS